MYDKILFKWIEKKITADDVNILARTGWITHQQAATILATPQN